MFRIFMLAAMALFSVTAHAATWYVFSARANDALYFFDFDTVGKKGDKVTIWEKYVKKPNSPDSDGSYAVAQKIVYSCSKRTGQAFAISTYDRKGEFIQSTSSPSTVSDIIPDSIGESILKTICASDFPRDKSGKDYGPVINNDIYGFTENFFGYIDAMKSDPAPK